MFNKDLNLRVIKVLSFFWDTLYYLFYPNSLFHYTHFVLIVQMMYIFVSHIVADFLDCSTIVVHLVGHVGTYI